MKGAANVVRCFCPSRLRDVHLVTSLIMRPTYIASWNRQRNPQILFSNNSSNTMEVQRNMQAYALTSNQCSCHL